MPSNAPRGRHAGVSKKNLTRVTASVAVTGGLVAGIATAATSGSSAAEPTASQSATVKAAASAASPAPVAPQPAAPAKKAPAKEAAKKTESATHADRHAVTAAATVSRSQARQAITAHHPAKLAQHRVAAHTAPKPARAVPAATAVASNTTHVDAVHKAAVKVAKPAQHEAPAARVAQRSATVATPAVARAAQPAQAELAVAKTATPAASSTATTQSVSAAPASSSSVIAAAQRYSGIPYVWGGSSTSGADCSGYVAMVYQSVGKTLPHSSSAMQAMATPVSAPQPGDLVFTPGHVGIYAGNGQAYQALHPGTTSGLYPIYGSGVSYGRV